MANFAGTCTSDNKGLLLNVPQRLQTAFCAPGSHIFSALFCETKLIKIKVFVVYIY